MKKALAVVLSVIMLLTLFSGCGDDKLTGPQKEILGSWYFVGEDAHFMEFYKDGTARCLMIPEVTYTYSFDGSTLVLSTPAFTREYDSFIDDEGYLHYTWFDKGTPVNEICEKR